MSAYIYADRLERPGDNPLFERVFDDLTALSHHTRVLGLAHTDGARMLAHARDIARATAGWATDETILGELGAAIDELYGELPVVDSLPVRRIDDLLNRLRDNVDALLEYACTAETVGSWVA